MITCFNYAIDANFLKYTWTQLQETNVNNHDFLNQILNYAVLPLTGCPLLLEFTKAAKTSLQCWTAHELLQYSSSHSGLTIANFWQPSRIHLLLVTSSGRTTVTVASGNAGIFADWKTWLFSSFKWAGAGAAVVWTVVVFSFPPR